MQILRLLSALALLSASLLATAAPKGERVLVTAHSFHIFTAPRFASLAQAAGIEGHKLVAAQMIGGSKVIQHWNLPDEKQKAKPALAAAEVDVMTMSPHVYLPDEGIDRFVELGAKHNPKLRFLVQHSWTPWDGWVGDEKVAKNEDRDERPLDKVRAANLRFRELLETQINGLNKGLGREAVCIVPVGDAVLKLRELIAVGKPPASRSRPTSSPTKSATARNPSSRWPPTATSRASTRSRRSG